MEPIKVTQVKRPAVQEPTAVLQVVDPAVTKRKFEEEVGAFLAAAAIYRKKGVIVLDHSFPDIKLMFCASSVQPAPVVFAVNINFTNYDLEPLSVRFINPFTGELIRMNELCTVFKKQQPTENGTQHVIQLALQGKDGLPFICLPGVREYHQHPDHSNDPWLTHRGKGGEGTLGHIIEKLHQYGVSNIIGYQLPPLVLGGLQLGINSIPT